MDPNPITLDFLTPKIPPMINGDESPRRKFHRLADYVAGLEAERRKIEAFKRELPLCLNLLNDAVERFGEELKKSREAVECSVGEVGGLNCENGVDDMKNWMSSAQLWNHHADDSSHLKSVVGEESVAKEIRGCSDDKVMLMQPVVAPVTELYRLCSENVEVNGGKTVVDELNVQNKIHYQPRLQQVCRKQRRCWSPDLHRRFVDALQQLGGSEVATPKQIRDIMRVEGLTNDEVKSHLQKFRLHSRKASPSPFSPTSTCHTASHDDFLSKLNKKSPQGPLDRSAGSGKCSTSKSNNTMPEEDDENETEGHSWQNRIIFRPCLPTC